MSEKRIRKVCLQKKLESLFSQTVFDCTDNFVEGDKIIAEWEINGEKVWWDGTIIKVTNKGRGFGNKIARLYVVKYEPYKTLYPEGKIMDHFFIDDRRLFDVKEKQLITYYSD